MSEWNVAFHGTMPSECLERKGISNTSDVLKHPWTRSCSDFHFPPSVSRFTESSIYHVKMTNLKSRSGFGSILFTNGRNLRASTHFVIIARVTFFSGSRIRQLVTLMLRAPHPHSLLPQLYEIRLRQIRPLLKTC